MTYRGDIDLPRYYIVSKKFVEFEPGQKSNGNRKVQVRYLKFIIYDVYKTFILIRLKLILDAI